MIGLPLPIIPGQGMQRPKGRLLFGFDHNYGFPAGFYEALWGVEPDSWEQVLEDYYRSVEQFAGWEKESFGMRSDPMDEAAPTAAGHVRNGADWLQLEQWSPREWAREANMQISRLGDIKEGSFWGSRFGPKPDAGMFRTYPLPDGRSFALHDRRLVEMRYRRLQPRHKWALGPWPIPQTYPSRLMPPA